MQKGFCTCQESKVLQQVVRNQGASTVEEKIHERIYEGEEKIRQSLKLELVCFEQTIHAKNRWTPLFGFGLVKPSAFPFIRVLEAGLRPNSVKAALMCSSALVAMVQYGERSG